MIIGDRVGDSEMGGEDSAKVKRIILGETSDIGAVDESQQGRLFGGAWDKCADQFVEIGVLGIALAASPCFDKRDADSHKVGVSHPKAVESAFELGDNVFDIADHANLKMGITVFVKDAVHPPILMPWMGVSSRTSRS